MSMKTKDWLGEGVNEATNVTEKMVATFSQPASSVSSRIISQVSNQKETKQPLKLTERTGNVIENKGSLGKASQ